MTIEKRLTAVGQMDKKALEKLFREYFASLMTFSRKFLGDEDDAREVVQEVFIKLWEKRNELDYSTSLRSYLYTAVYNRSLNMIRDRRKFSPEEVPEQAGTVDVSAQIEALELEDKIREAVDSLPEKCRKVFEMSRFDGLKYGEIAVQLGISVKTVENQMSKALKIMREKLANHLIILLLWILQNLN